MAETVKTDSNINAVRRFNCAVAIKSCMLHGSTFYALEVKGNEVDGDTAEMDDVIKSDHCNGNKSFVETLRATRNQEVGELTLT